MKIFKREVKFLESELFEPIFLVKEVIKELFYMIIGFDRVAI